MFFSRAVLVAISFAISVLATPHALNHVPHHRAIAARVAPNNNHTALHRRQSSPRCRQRLTSSYVPASSSYTPASPSYTPTPPSPIVSATHTKPPSPVSSYTPPAPTTTAPGSSSGDPSFMSGVQTGGDGTFYSVGLGACGNTNTDNQFVVAVSFKLFNIYPGYNGVNSNNNPICGRTIEITYQGKSHSATVVDVCEGCMIQTSLDMSPTLFQVFADPSVGRIHDITWTWT